MCGGCVEDPRAEVVVPDDEPVLQTPTEARRSAPAQAPAPRNALHDPDEVDGGSTSGGGEDTGIGQTGDFPVPSNIPEAIPTLPD